MLDLILNPKVSNFTIFKLYINIYNNYLLL